MVLFLFILAEVIIAVFYRSLASYNSSTETGSFLFHGSPALYWRVLGLMLLAYFVILVVEYFILNLCIVNSSNTAHRNMIHSIVRSPSSFFDETPSGILVNKLSNDLGTIDNNLFFALTEGVEGPISTLIAVINISLINPTFIIPALLVFLFTICFFNYSRYAYLKCKELFLQSKNIMVDLFLETINGLTQIKLYKQKSNKMQQFSETLDSTTKSGISY